MTWWVVPTTSTRRSHLNFSLCLLYHIVQILFFLRQYLPFKTCEFKKTMAMGVSLHHICACRSEGAAWVWAGGEGRSLPWLTCLLDVRQKLRQAGSSPITYKVQAHKKTLRREQMVPCTASVYCTSVTWLICGLSLDSPVLCSHRQWRTALTLHLNCCKL